MIMWEINSGLAWSLGRFCPDLPDRVRGDDIEPPEIREQFMDFLYGRLTISPDSYSHANAHVRAPWHEWSLINTPRYDESRVWHHDTTGYPEGEWHYMVVWSTVVGTEFRFPNGRVYQAPSHEVIIFNNDRFEHRSPSGRIARARLRDRWFARTFVRGQTTVLDVPDVYRLTFPVAESRIKS